MADDPKNAKEKPIRKSKAKIIILMTVVGCLIPFGLPSLVLCAGFLPTLVVLFTENDPRRPALAAIGYMNLAGVLPFMIELWEKGQTMPAALTILKESKNWVIMLGAAGIGQLILFVIPPFVASMVVLKQEARQRTLQEGMIQLEAIWGKEVTTSTPLDAVRTQQDA